MKSKNGYIPSHLIFIGWRLKKLFFILPILLSFAISSNAQNDLANPTAKNVTIPAGSFIIPMDSLNYFTSGGSQYFNLNCYGLIFTLLNNKIGIHWMIKSGKSKDGIDFSVACEKILPTAATGSTKSFRGGPFVIFAKDTAGVRSIINTYNAAVAASTTALTKTKVNIYRTTSSVVADRRYLLTQTPKVAILNDGGNASIQAAYFVDASVPSSNYSTVVAYDLINGCYNIATQPHNTSPTQANLDSIMSLLNQGGNFFAQCKGVFSYENFTPSGGSPGYFQTTKGIILDNTNTSLSYPNPDVAFNQFLGSFDATNVGGSEQVWHLDVASGSVFKNNGYITVSNGTPASGSHKYEHMSASVAKIQPASSAGGLMFFAGGHNYSKTLGTDCINGERMYFNACLTPCGTRFACRTLYFDIDMSIKASAPSCYLPGDTLTYLITVKHNGYSPNNATNVITTAALPSGLTYVSSSATKGSYASATGLWTITSMAYGDSAILTLKAVASSNTSYQLTTYVKGDAYDKGETNDTAIVTSYVSPSPTITGSSTSCTQKTQTYTTASVSGYTYVWTVSSGTITSGAGTNSVTVQWGNAGTGSISVKVTNTSVACSTTVSKTVTIYAIPIVSAGSGGTICAGNGFNLNGSVSGGTTTGRWSGGNGTYNPNDSTLTASYQPSASEIAAGFARLTLSSTNNHGCDVVTDTVRININPLPSPGISGTFSPCALTSETYTSSNVSGCSLGWSVTGGTISGSTTGSSINVNWGTGGSGSVSLTATNTTTGCSTTVTQPITINSKPSTSMVNHY